MSGAISSLPFFVPIMFIEPTYTTKQYWFTILLAGFILGVLSSALYLLLYWFLYVQKSFLFSLIYLIPLLGSTITVLFFKQKFVWKEFSYGATFKMSFIIGIISALIFGVVLFVAYNYFLESRIDLYENIENETLRRLMSPWAVSSSMFFINVVLSLFYSLIFAIFAKKKIKE